MNEYESVIANPRSRRARRELLAVWKRDRDPRAELLEKQLGDVDGYPVAGHWDILRRIDQLIADHGREWAGPIVALVDAYHYEAGLISHVAISASGFVSHAHDLVRLAPLLHVSLTGPVDLWVLSKVPQLAQLATLTVAPGSSVDDNAAVAFAASPHVRGLRGIDLVNQQIGESGLRALVSSPNLRDILYIDLSGNPCAKLSRDPPYTAYVNDGYYIVRNAGVDTLADAYDAAARGYDVGGPVAWPPPRARFSYAED